MAPNFCVNPLYHFDVDDDLRNNTKVRHEATRIILIGLVLMMKVSDSGKLAEWDGS